MSKPVAIVTGGASGIGREIVLHLLSKGYKVAIADVNKSDGEALASAQGDDAIFIQADVSLYDQQKTLFAKTFAWGGNRLDFLAANAGIDDRQILYTKEYEVDEDGIPKPLNLKTLEVDLIAVIQGLWLFRHFAGKNQKPGGKVMITSSAAGLYSMETNPQYSTAKAGLIGLTRSVGTDFLKENITVNCICPAFFVTNLCPPHVRDIFPKEHITPMSTMLRALDTFLGDDQLTGQIAELTLDEIHYRQRPEWANESQRWIGEGSAGFWDDAYKAAPANTAPKS